MDTERMELVGGGWWEVRKNVTRGMRKAFRKAMLKGYLGGLDGRQDVSDPEALRKAVLSNPASWDLDALDDAYLAHGTVGWGFETKPTLEAIDALPEETVAPVLGKMRELYAERTEEARKN